MGNISKPIAASLKFTDFIVQTVTADLDNETARRRSRETDGASIAWVLGHLCQYRYRMMELLGSSEVSPFIMFDEGATDGSGYPTIEDLVASWRDVSARVVPLVERAADEVLLAPMGGPDAPHGEKTKLDTMVFYMWHESYHMGQLGTLRAQFGLTPTATLAQEAGAA